MLRRVHADEVAPGEGLEVLLGGGDRRHVGGVRRRVGQHGGDALVVHDVPLLPLLVVRHGARVA